MENWAAEIFYTVFCPIYIIILLIFFQIFIDIDFPDIFRNQLILFSIKTEKFGLIFSFVVYFLVYKLIHYILCVVIISLLKFLV